MNFFSKNNRGLKTVYEDDLVDYLRSIGVYDAIVKGEYHCKFCGNTITVENLEIIVPNTSGIKIVCNNKNCINQL